MQHHDALKHNEFCKYEVFTVMVLQVMVFWVVMMCSDAVQYDFVRGDRRLM